MRKKQITTTQQFNQLNLFPDQSEQSEPEEEETEGKIPSLFLESLLRGLYTYRGVVALEDVKEVFKNWKIDFQQWKDFVLNFLKKSKKEQAEILNDLTGHRVNTREVPLEKAIAIPLHKWVAVQWHWMRENYSRLELWRARRELSYDQLFDGWGSED